MSILVYITVSGDDLIRIYRMDRDGQLQHRHDVPAIGGPSALADSPDGRTLYCSLRASNELAAFRIEQEGELHLLGKRQVDADACYLAPDKTGRFLMSAYYRAGKAMVHLIESDGSIGEELCNVPTAARAHCIETDESNRYALVPHPLDANSIFLFQFDEKTGQLSPNPSAPRVVAADGLGPRHFVFSLDQRFVYTSDEDASSVTAYYFDRPGDVQTQSSQNGCTLRPFQTISSLPEGFAGANTTAQIHLHPNGRTLYVTNRGHESIAIFSLDPGSGAIELQGWQSTEAVPRVFNVDPEGRFLLAAGQGTGNAAVYSIEPESGLLSHLNAYEVGKQPMWVLFRQQRVQEVG